MKLDPEQLERLRINILRQCKAAGGDLGLAISALQVGAKLEAFKVEDEVIAEQCLHLSDPQLGLLRVADQRFSTAVKRYVITALGREWLEVRGF